MTGTALDVVVLTNDSILDATIASLDEAIVAKPIPWSDGGEPLDVPTLARELADERFAAICIGPDVPLELGLAVSRHLDLHHPELGVVLLRASSRELWRDAARSGIRDIVEPSELATDFVPALLAAAQRSDEIRAARLTPDEPTGRVIVVLSPKGGSGKTMLTTNIGIALASSGNGQTVVADLDCVFGDIASVMGLVPEHTIGELAMVPSFDSTTLKVHLSRHERSGLYVLAGSGRPEEGEAVTDEVATRAIRFLSRDFPYVVVDTAAGLDERALAAIELATDIVLLASMDVASVRNLAKEVDALNRLGFTGARRHFVLNRADTHVGLDVADVEAAVGLPVSAAIPSSRDVPLSMNQGRTLAFDEPGSPVAREMLGLANQFLDPGSVPIVQPRASRFSLRRR